MFRFYLLINFVTVKPGSNISAYQDALSSRSAAFQLADSVNHEMITGQFMQGPVDQPKVFFIFTHS
jgi:hypothetical protein